MLFNSYLFILAFLPITLIGYYGLHKAEMHNMAKLELILGSFVFYAYNNVYYVVLLAFSILFNWCMSRLIQNSKEKRGKKIFLIIGLCVDIGLLLYFKYFNFFISNANLLFKSNFIYRNIILPLGISFFTFQQISYLVDTYREDTTDYNFLEYAAFISFFPQLVAGPIVLHSELIPQFREKENWKFSHEYFAEGLYIFSLGLLKKVIIADTLGKAVTWGWTNIDYLTAMEIVVVMISYTFQIYFDFSGYCDMAIGIGKMFHISLPVNFNSPYKADSIVEFWKRWHMTLTRFLTKYVYIPLGGNRKGKLRTYVNIIIVFLVSGLWHGANWTFVLWGFIHGVANALNRMFDGIWKKIHYMFRWIITFGFLNFTWLLFRSNSVSQAINLLKRILLMRERTINLQLQSCYVLPGVEWLGRHFMEASTDILAMACMILALGGSLLICLKNKNLHEKAFQPSMAKVFLTSVALVWSVVSLSGISTFLYFNF